MYTTTLPPAQSGNDRYPLVSPVETPTPGFQQYVAFPSQYHPTPTTPRPVLAVQQPAIQEQQFVPQAQYVESPSVVLSAPIASNLSYVRPPPESRPSFVSDSSTQSLAEKLELAAITDEIKYEEKPKKAKKLSKQEEDLCYGDVPLPRRSRSRAKKKLEPTSPHPELKDEKMASSKRRFVGDTLIGRVARAGVATVTSMAKMPEALSPWGDNNPVTLPNVRYRDAVMSAVFAAAGPSMVHGTDVLIGNMFGAEHFLSQITCSSAGFLIGHSFARDVLFEIIEQAVDTKLVDRILPEEEKIITSTDMKMLQVAIKHKMMGTEADLRLHNVKPAKDLARYEKGWFCPYLYASARTPSIPRSQDFEIAQCFGPFLAGDYALAHKLLGEIPSVYPLCEVKPEVDIGCNRLLLLFTGIVPYRAEMWSTSRRPGAAMINFQLLNGCPGLVVPVTDRAPLIAWSPFTLKQMHHPWYVPEEQHGQICNFLDTIISQEHLPSAIGDRYESMLARAVSMVINGALKTKEAPWEVMHSVDKERAGIVMFRY